MLINHVSFKSTRKDEQQTEKRETFINYGKNSKFTLKNTAPKSKYHHIRHLSKINSSSSSSI